MLEQYRRSSLDLIPQHADEPSRSYHCRLIDIAGVSMDGSISNSPQFVELGANTRIEMHALDKRGHRAPNSDRPSVSGACASILHNPLEVTPRG